MSFLLDTHIVLWWLENNVELGGQILDIIDSEPEVFISPVTPWEIAYKQRLGKLKGPDNLPDLIRDGDIPELPIRHSHAITAARLPLIHRDPYDRILIAQCIEEKMTLVTRDATIRQYEVAVLPA
jgi:PIN domain nuclease of toxin-antitoxin system